MWQVQSIFDWFFLGCNTGIWTGKWLTYSVVESFLPNRRRGRSNAAASVAANLGICRAKWTCGRLPRLGHDRWINGECIKRPPNFTNIMPNRRFRAALKAVVYCTIWRSNESGIGFVCPLWGIWQLSTMARVARECPILTDRRTAQRSLKRQALSEAGIGAVRRAVAAGETRNQTQEGIVLKIRLSHQTIVFISHHGNNFGESLQWSVGEAAAGNLKKLTRSDLRWEKSPGHWW